MLSVRAIALSDIENTEYELKSNRDSYVILENEMPIAYLWFDVIDKTMELGMIEVN